MEWYFKSKNVVCDYKTGFTIHLSKGTWRQPQNITPESSNLTPYQQARLLRHGMEYAKQNADELIAC